MKYVSILRGINVSAQKIIKMAELKFLYEEHGFQNVVTYIQSGNVIFDANDKDKSKLKKNIENFIEDKYKFHVPVEIRSHREISNVIKHCPFDSVNLAESGTKILVTFLASKPPRAKMDDLLKHVIEPEKLVIKDTEIYLFCPNGYGKSKLSNTFIEQKLGISATTRNWKSVHKLEELSSD